MDDLGNLSMFFPQVSGKPWCCSASPVSEFRPHLSTMENGDFPEQTLTNAIPPVLFRGESTRGYGSHWSLELDGSPNNPRAHSSYCFEIIWQQLASFSSKYHRFCARYLMKLALSANLTVLCIFVPGGPPKLLLIWWCSLGAPFSAVRQFWAPLAPPCR